MITVTPLEGVTPKSNGRVKEPPSTPIQNVKVSICSNQQRGTFVRILDEVLVYDEAISSSPTAKLQSLHIYKHEQVTNILPSYLNTLALLSAIYKTYIEGPCEMTSRSTARRFTEHQPKLVCRPSTNLLVTHSIQLSESFNLCIIKICDSFQYSVILHLIYLTLQLIYISFLQRNINLLLQVLLPR